MTDTNTTKFQYQPKTPYEITFCPSDAHQRITVKDLTQRYRHWHKAMYNLFQQLDQSSYYYMIPEVSEPQSSHGSKYPRLHLHGIISFKSSALMAKFLIEDFYPLSQVGIIQLNPFRSEWMDYITKQSYIRKYALVKKLNYEISNTHPDSILKPTNTTISIS